MEPDRKERKKTNAPETGSGGSFGSTVTLVFSDIRGFTQYTDQYGDEAAYQVLREHNAIVRKQIEAFGGQVVKTQGDSFMVAFTTARGAILCAVAIQRALGEANRNQSGTRIAIGIGINTGEPIQEGGDFFGGMVNLAARICAAAGPSEIFIAETTRYVAGRIESVEFVDRGLHELKGFQEPQRIIEVRWQQPGAEPSGAKEAETTAAMQSAIDVLNRVLGIAHADDPVFRPLVECQAKASDLRLTLSRSASDRQSQSVQRIKESIRPFEDFVTLLVERDTLEEQRSAQIETSVARSFGWPLVTAAARGRLSFAGAPAPAATPKPAPRPAPPAPAPRPAPAPAAPAPPSPAPTPMSVPPPVSAPPPPPAPTNAPPPAPKAVEVPTGFAGQHPSAIQAPVAKIDPRGVRVPWWAPACEAWSEWKSSGIAWAYALRLVVAEYPHLLAVPIRESAAHAERLAASYFLLLEHVENQSPSFVQTAVARALGQGRGAGEPEALGRALYELLVTDGRLRETYAAFVGDVMGAAIPNPGLWADARIVEHDDATDIITHRGSVVGETLEQTERVTAPTERAVDHRFAVALAPLTTRFFHIKPGILKTPRDVEIKVTKDGQPSDHAWHVTLKTSLVVRSEPKRLGPKGVVVKGLGREFAGLWIGVFNADASHPATYEVVMAVRPPGPTGPTGPTARKSSPFAPPGRRH
jgi:class 3 adenylate cyclase